MQDHNKKLLSAIQAAITSAMMGLEVIREQESARWENLSWRDQRSDDKQELEDDLSLVESIESRLRAALTEFKHINLKPSAEEASSEGPTS